MKFMLSPFQMTEVQNQSVDRAINSNRSISIPYLLKTEKSSSIKRDNSIMIESRLFFFSGK